jgi:hypothetical protein
MTMTTENNEGLYLLWCGKNGLDPDLGTTAREFEERIAGQPIEEWWDEMDADAAERMFWDDDPRRLR